MSVDVAIIMSKKKNEFSFFIKESSVENLVITNILLKKFW